MADLAFSLLSWCPQGYQGRVLDPLGFAFAASPTLLIRLKSPQVGRMRPFSFSVWGETTGAPGPRAPAPQTTMGHRMRLLLLDVHIGLKKNKGLRGRAGPNRSDTTRRPVRNFGKCSKKRSAKTGARDGNFVRCTGTSGPYGRSCSAQRRI